MRIKESRASVKLSLKHILENNRIVHIVWKPDRYIVKHSLLNSRNSLLPSPELVFRSSISDEVPPCLSTPTITSRTKSDADTITLRSFYARSVVLRVIEEPKRWWALAGSRGCPPHNHRFAKKRCIRAGRIELPTFCALQLIL